MSWLVGGLEVEQRGVGHGHDAGGGIDGKAAAGVVGQAKVTVPARGRRWRTR